jgi:hypothetical protein
MKMPVIQYRLGQSDATPCFALLCGEAKTHNHLVHHKVQE